MTYRTDQPMRYPPGDWHPSRHVVTRDDATRILSPMDPGATQQFPRFPSPGYQLPGWIPEPAGPKPPPDTSWLVTPEASYRPVQVPENRSSIPGEEDKKDWGLRLILAILSLALVANTAAFAYVAWLLR